MPLDVVAAFLSERTADFGYLLFTKAALDHETLVSAINALADMDLDPDISDRYVYVAREKHSKRIKIGVSKDPAARFKALGVRNPEELVLVAVYKPSGDGLSAERRAHRLLSAFRIRGEWFRPDADYTLIGDPESKRFA